MNNEIMKLDNGDYEVIYNNDSLLKTTDNIKDKVHKLTKIEAREKRKKYKLLKRGGEKPTNREHLIARAEGGSNYEDNFKQSLILAHKGKHLYLGNKLPHQQLLQILADNLKVFGEKARVEFIEEVEVLIEYRLENGELYNEKCFKSKNFIPKKL